MKKMTIWGVGPQIMFPAYSILFVLSWIPIKISILRILSVPGLYITAISLILICIGIILLGITNSQIKDALKTNQLITTGLFSRLRNPMYAAHLFFLMPGICLLTNNAITLLSIICTVIIFKALISKEEKVLEENFGIEYMKYKKRVRRLLPKLYINALH